MNDDFWHEPPMPRRDWRALKTTLAVAAALLLWVTALTFFGG